MPRADYMKKLHDIVDEMELVHRIEKKMPNAFLTIDFGVVPMGFSRGTGTLPIP